MNQMTAMLMRTLLLFTIITTIIVSILIRPTVDASDSPLLPGHPRRRRRVGDSMPRVPLVAEGRLKASHSRHICGGESSFKNGRG